MALPGFGDKPACCMGCDGFVTFMQRRTLQRMTAHGTREYRRAWRLRRCRRWSWALVRSGCRERSPPWAILSGAALQVRSLQNLSVHTTFSALYYAIPAQLGRASFSPPFGRMLCIDVVCYYSHHSLLFRSWGSDA